MYETCLCDGYKRSCEEKGSGLEVIITYSQNMLAGAFSGFAAHNTSRWVAGSRFLDWLGGFGICMGTAVLKNEHVVALTIL